MNQSVQHRAANKLLVVMPTWIGDTVMATPTLRALRALYPQAQITALVRSMARPMLDACPWLDRIITIRPRGKGRVEGRRRRSINLTRRLAGGKFDAAVLLPNSFRIALIVRMARIPRRIGYDRDARGFLLTDRLLPLRRVGRYVPTSTRDYYLGLARYLGAVDPDPTMRLFTRPEDDARADNLLRAAGYEPGQGRPLVLINPGASYGEAKMWYPDRFAAVAERCGRELGAAVAVTGAPRERAILDKVLAATTWPIMDLPSMGVDLRLLKSVVRQSALMITNDTGPRHIAAAMGVPVVSVFGPTDPAWTEIGFKEERMVRVEVFCGPCQKKHCPLDHRCMTRIGPDMVFQEATALLRSIPAKG